MVLAIDSVVAKRAMAGVVVGQKSQGIEKVRAIGAVATRFVSASDDAWLLAIDANVIFRTVTKVTANQVLTGGIVLTRVWFAFVNVFVTPVGWKEKQKN